MFLQLYLQTLVSRWSTDGGMEKASWCFVTPNIGVRTLSVDCCRQAICWVFPDNEFSVCTPYFGDIQVLGQVFPYDDIGVLTSHDGGLETPI